MFLFYTTEFKYLNALIVLLYLEIRILLQMMNIF